MFSQFTRTLFKVPSAAMQVRRSGRLSSNAAVTSQPQAISEKKVTKRKAGTGTNEIDQDGFTIPSTPKRKKGRIEPPSTPTPAAASIMGLPYSSSDIDDTAPPRRNRLANPLFTNAPLISPQTSRIILNESIPTSPSKKIPAELTTEGILEKACSHLISADPKMKALVEKAHCHVFSPEGLAEEIDPFRSLVSGIISQQVSGAAAKSIKAKFVALFNEGDADSLQHSFPTPAQVAASNITLLRTAGLSQRKAEYVTGLAEKFASGELSTEMLMKAEYEVVLEKLIAVRGLGKWSVEMFALFGLKRFDVFSTGDLGVQRGMAAFMGRDVSKLKAKGGGKWKYMPEKEMLEVAEKFAPYRSLFMWYMWRAADTEVVTMEK